MKFSSILLATSVQLIAAAAFAQSTTATLPTYSSSSDSSSSSSISAGENKASLSSIIGNKKFNETEEVTDAKLKADSGSLSKYSLSLNLSYYGPTVTDLSAQDQPNPDGSIKPTETAMAGSLGGRYRISSDTSLSAGTGLKAVHPFNGLKRFDVNDPYLNYNMLNRVAGIQMRNSFGTSYITTPAYKNVGEVAGVSYDQSMVYNLGTSHLALGLDSTLGYYFYGRGYRLSKKGVRGDGKASRYNLSMFPTLKYNFTDKFNVNTSVGLSYANRRYRDDQSTWESAMVSQRLTFGYAVTRDIYIAPYLNFFPEKVDGDLVTLNISTVFSIL